MNEKLVELLKGKSREEREEIFKNNRSRLLDESLNAVNGGNGAEVENPNSEECPYNGNWVSSFGYVCDGIVQC